jgi:hypothetical protein
MQRVALIDPKPLTRRSIGELLAEAFPECAMVVASTCEELLETEGSADQILLSSTSEVRG